MAQSLSTLKRTLTHRHVQQLHATLCGFHRSGRCPGERSQQSSCHRVARSARSVIHQVSQTVTDASMNTVSPVTVSSQWRSLRSATRHYSWHRALCEISSDSYSGICGLAVSWLWISQFNALAARFCKIREERVPSTVRVTQQTALHSWLETHVRIRSLEDLRQTWAPSADRRRISPLWERSGLRTLGCVPG